MFLDTAHPVPTTAPDPTPGPTPADDLTELSTDDLERGIASLAAEINAATCRWLGLVAEFERRDGHDRFGFVSCASWLAWRCSLDSRSAREQVRVARCLAGLPVIRAAFATGGLSYSKVRALTRVAEPDMEPELVELAHHATAAQLERLMRGYRGAITDDSHARASERRHLSTRWDDDGSLVIRGSLPAEEGAALLKSLELAREGLWRERQPDESEAAVEDGEGVSPNGARGIDDADALLAIAETTIAQGISAVTGGDRQQVVVHVDLDALSSGSSAGGGQGEVVDSVPIPAETVRRLACDASVVTLVEQDGEPLSVGRKTRSIPPAIARALRSRDACCQFPGCERDRFVDAHHIKHWAHGGDTSLGNLVRLCRHHHRLVHEGGFSVERSGGADGDLVFRRPGGQRIPTTPRLRESPPTRTPRPNSRTARATLRLDDPGPSSRGGRMDLDLGVFALAQLRGKRVGGQAPPGG